MQFISANTPVFEFMQVSHDGSEATDGDYKVATFTSSGTLTVTALGTDPTYGDNVEYLVVAGGGGGAAGNSDPRSGGGGGAGGHRAATGLTVTAIAHTVTVGAAGSGAGDPSWQGYGFRFWCIDKFRWWWRWWNSIS